MPTAYPEAHAKGGNARTAAGGWAACVAPSPVLWAARLARVGQRDGSAGSTARAQSSLPRCPCQPAGLAARGTTSLHVEKPQVLPLTGQPPRDHGLRPPPSPASGHHTRLHLCPGRPRGPPQGCVARRAALPAQQVSWAAWALLPRQGPGQASWSEEGTPFHTQAGGALPGRGQQEQGPSPTVQSPRTPLQPDLYPMSQDPWELGTDSAASPGTPSLGRPVLSSAWTGSEQQAAPADPDCSSPPRLRRAGSSGPPGQAQAPAGPGCSSRGAQASPTPPPPRRRPA